MIDNEKAYNTWHAARFSAEQSGEAILRPWHQTVLRRLPDLNGKRLLEVGCGRGDFAILLARTFPQAKITAVDFSETAIHIAREKSVTAGTVIEFLVENAESLRLDDGSFDVVISCECMEHVPDPLKMAGELCRVLKHGGQFILTTENYFNGMVMGWLVAWLRRSKYNSGSGPQPHENFFVFWCVKRYLEQGGLRVEHMESNHFQWLLLPRIAPHKLCTEDFKSPAWKRIFRPFGRHFTFEGRKV